MVDFGVKIFIYVTCDKLPSGLQESKFMCEKTSDFDLKQNMNILLPVWNLCNGHENWD